MSRALGGLTTSAPSLKTLFEPVARELAEVETILRSELRSDHPFVDELVRYGCLLGGKRLRPALLLLAAKAVGKVRDEHLLLAAVVEMIHTATLIHDDVLDGAATRRHLATVNSRWDNEASVLLGDFLFTHAFFLASTLDTTYACRRIGEATNLVCEGELRQKGSRGKFALTEPEYLSIVDAKTAELCACCCALGAHVAGADHPVVQRLDAYGRHLGIAFQIADDLLDVVGDESVVGKSLGTDLEKQKPTLPLIRLLHVVDSGERRQLISMLEGDPAGRRQQLLPYLHRHDAISYTQRAADRYARRAYRQLDDFQPTPAVETLRLLTHFVARRSA
jgi:octaprenyl-diphosphate synthase